MINNDIKIIGLIGNPVKHSKSPQMHNALFAKLGLKYEYLAFNVAAGELERAVTGLKAMNLAGANVTVPHKVDIIPYLDAISQEVVVIGAVNTIVNKDGRLIGYNTDGAGYLQSLVAETEIDLTDKRVLILGAGGAARAIAYTLGQEELAELTILNRDLDKAQALANNLSVNFPLNIAIIDEINSYAPEADLIINTTTVGMTPHTDQTLVARELIHAGQLVSDIVYNPQETRLLREAAEQGARTHGGLGMFINQGALAFAKWTGIEPDTDFMRETVLAALAAVDDE